MSVILSRSLVVEEWPFQTQQKSVRFNFHQRKCAIDANNCQEQMKGYPRLCYGGQESPAWENNTTG